MGLPIIVVLFLIAALVNLVSAAWLLVRHPTGLGLRLAWIWGTMGLVFLLAAFRH